MNRVGIEHNLVGTDLEPSLNQVETENKTFSHLLCSHIAMRIPLTWQEAIGLEI